MNKFLISIFSLFLFIGVISCNKDEDPAAEQLQEDALEEVSEDSVDTEEPEEQEEEYYSQYGTPFDGVPEVSNVIMYEVNLRAFSSTGDIQGVIDKLDHIESLGINTIWLMPIYPDGQERSVNSPYAVKDYKEVGEEYGTLEDLRALTDEAHRRGIAIILDWVANHTAWDNAWIENRSWYTQRNGEIVHPPGTNWEDVADLNFNNNDMRLAMIDAMQYWLYEANVDGFRCDYADGVPRDFWEEAISAIDTIREREFILLAEGARKDHFDAGFDLAFSWEFYGAIKSVFDGESVGRVFEANESEYSGIPAGKHWLRFTTNHDESAWDATPISLFGGKDGAVAASVMTLFTGGVPLIYGSQEIGQENTVPFFSRSSLDWDQNPEMLLNYQAILQYYDGSAAAKKKEYTNFSSENVFSLQKNSEVSDLLVIVNPGDSSVIYTLPDALRNTIWTDFRSEEVLTLENELELNSFQYYILEKQN